MGRAGPLPLKAMADEDLAVAYTYAWWLTGDEGAAVAAARSATASQAVAAAEPGRRLEILLREVRATAAPTPTMCPASEVALLHDAHGLALEDAAAVVAVDAADARTELAHGRLEALSETVIDPFTHPERLGGLAVGNPADVAHARQCDNCAQARDLLGRGRAELRLLPTPPVPAALAAADDPAGDLGPPATGARRATARPGHGRPLVALALAVVAVVAVVLLTLGGR